MRVLYVVDSEQVLVERGSGDYLSLVRSGPWPTGSNFERKINRPRIDRRTPMKKLFLAVALVVAFAAPAMAGHQFPNPYATNVDARGQ